MGTAGDQAHRPGLRTTVFPAPHPVLAVLMINPSSPWAAPQHPGLGPEPELLWPEQGLRQDPFQDIPCTVQPLCEGKRGRVHTEWCRLSIMQPLGPLYSPVSSGPQRMAPNRKKRQGLSDEAQWLFIHTTTTPRFSPIEKGRQVICPHPRAGQCWREQGTHGIWRRRGPGGGAGD